MNLPIIAWVIENKATSDYIHDPDDLVYEVVGRIGSHEIVRVPAPEVTSYAYEYGDDHNDLIAEVLAPYFARLFAPIVPTD